MLNNDMPSQARLYENDIVICRTKRSFLAFLKIQAPKKSFTPISNQAFPMLYHEKSDWPGFFMSHMNRDGT